MLRHLRPVPYSAPFESNRSAMSTAAEIDRLRADFDEALQRVATAQDLQTLRDRYLGRKQGLVTALYAGLGQAPPERRRDLGQQANDLKRHVETGLDACKATIGAARAPRADVDLTLARVRCQWAHATP